MKNNARINLKINEPAGSVYTPRRYMEEGVEV